MGTSRQRQAHNSHQQNLSPLPGLAPFTHTEKQCTQHPRGDTHCLQKKVFPKQPLTSALPREICLPQHSSTLRSDQPWKYLGESFLDNKAEKEIDWLSHHVHCLGRWMSDGRRIESMHWCDNCDPYVNGMSRVSYHRQTD